MNYIELSSVLRSHEMYLFTLADVKNLFPDEKAKTIKNNFIRWLSKGYFVRLKRDLYEFVEQGGELKIPDLYVANRLYNHPMFLWRQRFLFTASSQILLQQLLQ